jgi:hypothetical protein
MKKLLFVIMAAAFAAVTAAGAHAATSSPASRQVQTPETLAKKVEFQWHSRWRSHYRWGSGGGAYHNRHASHSHGYAHYHSRWRSHNRYGSERRYYRDHDHHSRWRSHHRHGSERHYGGDDYHSRWRSHHRYGSHRW